MVPTSEWIGNEEDPVPAVRAKPEASVVRAAARRRRGRRRRRWSAAARPGRRWPPPPSACAACKGVQRPALAVRLPVPGKPVLFLDVGANVEVRAQHLVQFAFLGAAFSEAVLGVDGPAVGLLTVGEEAGKGREEVVEAHATAQRGARASSSPATSRAATCPAATADVVVTDGFTGNVALKLMEGTAQDRRRRDPRRRPLQPDRRRSAACCCARRSAACAASSHPDTTGGAILLGLRGIAVVGHGSAGAEGIANAVRLAARCVEVDAVGRTAALLREGGAGRGALAARRRRTARDRKSADDPRRSPRPWSASTSPRSSRSTPSGSTRGPASRRTSTPTRSTSTSW